MKRIDHDAPTSATHCRNGVRTYARKGWRSVARAWRACFNDLFLGTNENPRKDCHESSLVGARRDCHRSSHRSLGYSRPPHGQTLSAEFNQQLPKTASDFANICASNQGGGPFAGKEVWVFNLPSNDRDFVSVTATFSAWSGTITIENERSRPGCRRRRHFCHPLDRARARPGPSRRRPDADRCFGHALPATHPLGNDNCSSS